MPGSNAQVLCLCAAFWVAILVYRGRQPLRFVAGLVFGALCAHLGWALLRADVIAAHPSLLLDPRAGYSALFVPFGMLLVAPWRNGEGDAAAFLSSSLRALPLALAVARLGCLASGCCAGVETALEWLPRHPVALYEVAGLAILHVVLTRTPRAFAAAAFCAGFGTLRLLLEPLRAVSPPAETSPADALLPVPLVAGLWVAVGLAMACPPLRPARTAVSPLRVETVFRSPAPRPSQMGDR